MRSVILASLLGLGLVAQDIPVFEPAVPTSYGQVAKYLNPGGDTYLYQNTAQWGETLDALLPPIRDLVLATVARHDQEEAQVVFELIEAFLKDSGLRALNGVGASSVPIGDGLHHNRLYFGQTEGEAKGLLWDAFAQDNTALPLLQELPADTVLATRIPVRAGLVWQWLRKTAAAIDNAELQGDIGRELARLQRAGLDLDSWFASLGDGLGLVLTLSPRPADAPPPDPNRPEAGIMDFASRASLAIIVEVKDDTIFSALEAIFAKQNAPLQRQDTGEIRVLAMQKPLPIPGQGPLAIARFGDYLAFVSNDRILKTLADGKGGLTETPEFKRLAARLPQRGMGFSYLSPRLGDELGEAMAPVANTMVRLDQGGMMPTMSVAGLFFQAASQLKGQASYAISVRTENGILAMNTATFGLGQALLGKVLTAPTMLLGPLLGVRVSGAQGNARRISDNANLKQIGTGIRMYAVDFGNRFPDDLGVLIDKEYLKTGRIYVVPGSPTKAPVTGADVRNGQCDYFYFGKGLSTAAPNQASVPIACTKPGLLPNDLMNVLYADGHVETHAGLPEDVKALIDAMPARRAAGNPQDVNYARIRGMKLGLHVAETMPKARVLLLLPPTPKGSQEEALATGLRTTLGEAVTIVDTVTLVPPKDLPEGEPWFTGKLVNEQTVKYQDKVDLVITGLGLPEAGIQELWFWAKGVKVALAAGDAARLKKALLAKLVIAAAATDPDVLPDEWPPPQDLDTAFAKRFLLVTPENAEALGTKHPKLFAP